MKWYDQKLLELKEEIKSHKGYGESQRFYQLRTEIKEKIGSQKWEKMLYKAKIQIVQEGESRG